MALTAVFGGTFDPVHNGHLAIAREAANRFHLDRVLFIPAGNPPHKTRGSMAPYDDRFRMIELACAEDPRFEPSRLEAGRAKSYSIETVERLKREGVGSIAFLIGADAFAEITTWHRWKDLIAEIEFIVVTRPGTGYEVPEGARVRRLDGMDIAVSSSAIRAQLAAGKCGVPVPAAVLRYIAEHGLYRRDNR